VFALLVGAALVLSGLSWGPARARADEGDIPSRRMGIRWNQKRPKVFFSARDLVNASVRRKLESGLPQRIDLSVFAYRERGGQPITAHARSCRVTYDLWERVYRVQLQTPRVDRSELVDSIDEVIETCLVARGVPIGTKERFEARSGRKVYFAVLVELNPMSADTVQRIRRWLARPATGGIEGEAFFGTFVSLFVNRRIGDAERTIRFRSQAVTVP
jgi:hypothetical protein